MTDAMDRGQVFLSLHDSGMTYQQIADEEGISRERVRQLIRLYVGDGHRMERAARKAARRKASEILVSGVSIAGAADILGCTNGIARALAEEGLISVQKNKWRKDPKHLEKLKELSGSGCTQVEAAKILGIAQPSVSVMCRRFGIDLRDGRKKD